MMHPTRSRRCRRAAATMTSQSARRSRPSTFQNDRLHSGVLQCFDSHRHQPRPQSRVVSLPVAVEPFELDVLRRDQQFEHEPALRLVQIELIFSPRNIASMRSRRFDCDARRKSNPSRRKSNPSVSFVTRSSSNPERGRSPPACTVFLKKLPQVRALKLLIMRRQLLARRFPACRFDRIRYC